MELFVGTSGWYYDWNRESTLDWYLHNSGLNAIELNASFYRFPFPNQVKSWVKKGSQLHWAVKVHRFITHQYKFSTSALKTWQRFLELFAPLEEYIDYYLFQLPPNLTSKSREKITSFLREINFNQKIALEFRHETWFDNEEIINWAKSLGLTIVSIDAPEFSRAIYKTTKDVYLRLHGRTGWYYHNYTKDEMNEIARKIFQAQAERVYIFFNNDHNMLNNARAMFSLLKNELKHAEECG